ncbi:MAG: asparagine synthase (glutamine-hydrolyzing) [Waddliaceae bacterium]
MCGIVGVVGKQYDQSTLRVMTQKSCRELWRRGPDQTNSFIAEGIALGAARLAIQDPEKGNQPMSFQGFTIVFNGEIYNKKAIQDRLLSHGHKLHTNCDTEVLLKAMVKFGDAFLPTIEGMFAFALWDEHSKTLTLARDRWGEKPLYYTVKDQTLTFSSEVKAFRHWPHIDWNIDPEDIVVFLKNSYIPYPKTGWKHIHKLQPGCCLKYKSSEVKIQRFFTPSFTITKTLPEPQDLFDILQSSVRKCMTSDRPVGAFLSGGLDSTSIAYLLSGENQGAPIFSLHWQEASHSEESFTKEVAEALKLNHFSIQCDSDFLKRQFDSIVDLYDEPFGDESMIPTYCLAQFAKERVDVVLTGDGADEFFTGYERYFFSGNFDEYLETFAPSSSLVMEWLGPHKNPFPMRSHSIDHPRNRSWIDMNAYLTDDILMKVDRACMGMSLESRCPFLMPAVTNFALGCPIESLVGTKQRGKEILRAAMKDHIPKRILERKKMGFGVPLNDWFRGPLRTWIKQRLLEGDLYALGLISKEGVIKLLSQNDEEQGEFARPLFNLLVLERWIKRWIKKH